jgi:beta-lactamase class A
MAHDFTRRGALMSGLALAACAPTSAPTSEPPPVAASPAPDDPRFAAIEARIGGRVGVAAWNTGTDAWLGHRMQERFAMCSTFKWLLAAAQLNLARGGGPQLGERVRFDESDLLDYAPVAREHLARGWMTIEECCSASVVMSDNTAANLLLEVQMGPEGLTRFLRSHGDAITRLDRNEPTLNENLPGDERDTTTPEAMARILNRFVGDDSVLLPADRDRIRIWMIESPTGRERLRAGLPSNWRVGDKTGTSGATHNATNDVAFVWPPNRLPIVIACYLSDSTVEPAARNEAHAEIARIIAEEWG